MASGIKLDESCKNMFSLIKDKHQHAFAIMKIKNDKEVVVVETHGKIEGKENEETSQAIFGEMKQKVEDLGGPCYILLDFLFRQSVGTVKGKPIYIYWCDDETGIKEKMKYAATNSELKRQCSGYEPFEIHDKTEFTYEEIFKELQRKDRQ